MSFFTVLPRTVSAPAYNPYHHQHQHPSCAPRQSAGTPFAPLLRLLDELDTQLGSSSACGPRHGGHDQQRRQQQQQQQAAQRTFQPRFDVRETGAAYELQGELPGIGQGSVQIEFVGPQTLVVRGRTERGAGADGSDEQPQPQPQQREQRQEVAEKTEDAETTPDELPAGSGSGDKAVNDNADAKSVAASSSASSAASKASKAHQATVEDDFETVEREEALEQPDDAPAAGNDRNSNCAAAEAEKPRQQPAPETEKAASPETSRTHEAVSKTRAAAAAAAEAEQPDPRSRYWIAERSVGAFQRSFRFPARVEQEGTRAELRDGVLRVTVPKAARFEGMRIVVG